jgi:hypothetical protein
MVIMLIIRIIRMLMIKDMVLNRIWNYVTICGINMCLSLHMVVLKLLSQIIKIGWV